MDGLETRANSDCKDFRDVFHEGDFPEFFRQIESYNLGLPAQAHRLRGFAILYTPVIRVQEYNDNTHEPFFASHGRSITTGSCVNI